MKTLRIIILSLLIILLPAMAMALTTVATGAAAISTTVTPAKAFYLKEIRLHLSAAGGAANLTVTMDAQAGAAYDVVLFTQDMTTVTDLVWRPDQPIKFIIGDNIVIAWANGSSRTYGLEVIYE